MIKNFIDIKLFLFIAVVFLAGCNKKESANESYNQNNIKDLSEYKDNVVQIILRQKGSPNPSNNICTGFVASPHLIISAAHCFKNDNPPYNDIFGIYSLHAGFPEKESKSRFDIESIKTHKDWPNLNAYADVAIIKLKPGREFQQMKSIPVLRAANNNIPAGSNVSAFGFTSASIIKSSVLKPNANELRAVGITQAQANQTICIKNELQPGDSGGPLYFTFNNKLYVVGVVASLQGCAAANSKTTFTALDSFLNWIEREAGVLLP